jgi:hypothetical protein
MALNTGLSKLGDIVSWHLLNKVFGIPNALLLPSVVAQLGAVRSAGSRTLVSWSY